MPETEPRTPDGDRDGEQARALAASAANGPGATSVPAPADARTRPSRPARQLAQDAASRVLNISSVAHNGITWIDVLHPGEPEIEWLRRHYAFHPLHIDDTISKTQRPKIDDSDDYDYTFIVMHFPVYSKLVRVTTPSEVDIFVGRNYIITAHTGALKPLVKLFKQCSDDPTVRAEVMGRSTGYILYQIIDRLVDYCFPILNKINFNIEQIEDEIFEEKVRHTVQEISIVRRDVIAFRRIIKPLVPVIASLERKNRPVLGEDMEEYFGSISDHLSKIWDTLEDYKEVIEGLSDTINSLTSNRINEIIKVLTIISVILLPLTLISGIYGMNISLPAMGHPMAFQLVIGLMLGVVVVMLGFFRWKKWI